MNKIYAADLIKVKSTHNNVRDIPMRGRFNYPVIGESFHINNLQRWIMTTPVTKIEIKDDTITIHTMNSTYRLEHVTEIGDK